MGMDRGLRQRQLRLVRAPVNPVSDFRMHALLFLLIVVCPLWAGCDRRQKIGNDRFSAIVVTQHSETLSGKKIVYPRTDEPQIVSHLVEIKPGGETGRHYHPGPTYMYVMEGILVVELDDGTVKEYQAGQGILEDGRTWVNNKNPGTIPTKFLAVIIGERGQNAVVFPQG